MLVAVTGFCFLAFASRALSQCANGQCRMRSTVTATTVSSSETVLRERVVKRGGIEVDEPWTEVTKIEKTKSGPIEKAKERKIIKAALAEAFELEVIEKVNEYRVRS